MWACIISCNIHIFSLLSFTIQCNNPIGGITSVDIRKEGTNGWHGEYITAEDFDGAVKQFPGGFLLDPTDTPDTIRFETFESPYIEGKQALYGSVT